MTSTLETYSIQDNRPLGTLLLGIIDKPTATFEAIVARRGWVVWLTPLLIILVAFAVLGIVQTPYSLEFAREQAERQLATLPAEQVEAARAAMSTTLSLPFMLATTLGFGSVMLIIIIVVQAAFFYFGALMSGGDDELRFGQVFKVSIWARLPLALGLLVQAGFIALTQRFVQYTGLAFLATSGDVLADAQNPMVALLTGVDLFWAWNLFLLVMGLAVVARVSWKKSLLLVAIYAVLALVVTVLPSLIFSGYMGG